MEVRRIDRCRICQGTQLTKVLDLGVQVLTGVFPHASSDAVTSGPLQLIKCTGTGGCGLLQLAHSYDAKEMYGDNYGYRSGLNASMVAHLQAKVKRIKSVIELDDDDLVVDIGSNDGTTLAAYSAPSLDLLGIDPTAMKFREYYPDHVDVIADFFSATLLKACRPGKKAKVVTSFSMFYDLEAPMEFMREVREVLADDGIWVFEQSYMPAMLEANSYDTVCHEHLEFYALRQIKWMTDRVGLRIIDLEFNEVNGGSFSVTVAKQESPYRISQDVDPVMEREVELGLDSLAPYQAFASRVARSRAELIEFLSSARQQGKSVAALGASTKGNVLLQYCGLGPLDVTAVGEVNREKFGRLTPGSLIPIIPEADLLMANPDYLLVLPWHFREFFLNSAHLSGRDLVFALPRLEVRRAGLHRS